MRYILLLLRPYITWYIRILAAAGIVALGVFLFDIGVLGKAIGTVTGCTLVVLYFMGKMKL